MIIFLSSCTFWLSAQTQGTLHKEFKFDDNTEEQEISFPVGQNTSIIHFAFKGRISKGNLKVTIYDPNNKKEGGFHLEAVSKKSGTLVDEITDERTKENKVISYTMSEGDDNSSMGSMSKEIKKPIPGTWKVKVSSKKLKGMLGVELGQLIVEE